MMTEQGEKCGVGGASGRGAPFSEGTWSSEERCSWRAFADLSWLECPCQDWAIPQTEPRYTFLFLLCFAASPSIKLLVDDPIVVNPGEAITLVCVTTGGEPAPSLTWVRSAGILPEKTVLNGGTLTIPAITSDDAGTYSCIANNNVGNPAKKSTNIIVRGKLSWQTIDLYLGRLTES